MITIAAFFAVLSASALLGIIAEYLYARAKQKNWHTSHDTIANLNLASGNVMMSTITAAMTLAGYAGLRTLRVVDLAGHLPRSAYLMFGFLLAEFLQYWNHRISHRWNFLWWGHATHHSSSYMNLSTAVRINWFYRLLAWPLYAPMALLGYTVEEFVLFQTLMNVYNLFMHTRLDIPFGPLGSVLVTPIAHRLHHTSDPKLFGNYGASLVIWDRLFGTFRSLGPADDPQDLPYGIERNVDAAHPMHLNFHVLADLKAMARKRGTRFIGLVFSKTEADAASSNSNISTTSPGFRAWIACAGVVILGVAINQAQSKLALGWRLAAATIGLTVVSAFGITLDRPPKNRAI